MRHPPPAFAALLAGFATLPGCGTPVAHPHPAASPPAVTGGRHGQPFEVTAVALRPDDCRVRARLPEPWSFGAWIDVRRAAVHAATPAARACCATPVVGQVSDWMAGFAAWEITFTCEVPIAGPSS